MRREGDGEAVKMASDGRKDRPGGCPSHGREQGSTSGDSKPQNAKKSALHVLLLESYIFWKICI